MPNNDHSANVVSIDETSPLLSHDSTRENVENGHIRNEENAKNELNGLWLLYAVIFPWFASFLAAVGKS